MEVGDDAAKARSWGPGAKASTFSMDGTRREGPGKTEPSREPLGAGWQPRRSGADSFETRRWSVSTTCCVEFSFWVCFLGVLRCVLTRRASLQVELT